MKLTKSQLKKIIREELSVLSEGGYAGHYGEPFLPPPAPPEEFDPSRRSEFPTPDIAKLKLYGALQDVVAKWRPETPEGQQYEEDIHRILDAHGDELREVRAPFPAGTRVKHGEHGEGVVTHAGTKNTNVAVKFDKETANGKKNRQVSRGSLKKAKK